MPDLEINPQTTLRGQMDPKQHLDSCKHETENYYIKERLTKNGCGVHWTPVESEMGVDSLGSMRV